MNETTKRMARLIDLSAVQATNTEADVRHCAELASRFRIISIHVLPCWTRFLSTLLPEQGRADVMIGGPVGFPSGGHATDIKVQEVRQLIVDGAREVDMVVNIGKVLSGDYDYVREDMRRVVEAAAPIPAKVILETHYLNEEQIRKMCDIAVEVGMAWVKTSTGWAPTGATEEKVAIIADQLRGRVQIKGAGGIRDLDTVRALYRLGVRRFGMSATATQQVLEQLEQDPSLFPELNNN
ncbi:deoxyribose-phosphate aldolase [Yersinia pseudotuberculosis]|uniref:Deoxyribose-phosphate aldolase n=1 Tax=Yersinia pseudotuberculosis TaxID=633 RepID=A0A380QBH6_YERPU|nr:deoxyribose-phosphate aldolase [Yersinia pseudotuberculosis]PSH20449.1 deoxyribose-phosphate aldolase [Yersinia pseudotuberculosis]SUP85036.1 deoxyribose-phosphate aldolase [Yersinia pseudotuberculosis]